jgi:hypothetical protein
MTGNDKTQIDPNNDSLDMGKQLRELTSKSSTKPKSGNAAAIGRAIVVLAIVIGGFVAYHIYSTNSLQTPLDEAKQTVTKLKSENGQLKMDLAKALTAKLVTDKAVAIAAAPAPIPVATPAPKVRGTFGVIIGTLYLPGQRKLFKEEVAAALDTCSDDTIKLELVLVETGNAKRLRHETKAVAMAKSGMTEKQAQAKAACLHEELPPVVKRDKDGKVATSDDGKPVMAKVVTETVDGSKEPLAKAPVVEAEE